MSGRELTVATWNVNSVRKRAAHIEDWLGDGGPDVLCLQETKVQDADFPAGVFDMCGYEVAVHGQKTYNGVAVASRLGLSCVERGLPAGDGGEARLISAVVGGVRVASVYVPNGRHPGHEKFGYKMGFFAALRARMAEMREGGPVAVGGDYNVAPADDDVYDIDEWGRGAILVSDDERAAFESLLDEGYEDAHVAAGGGAHAHTWWDYRAGNFRNDRGLRIDHFLVSGAKCLSAEVDKGPRSWSEPSDHAPVVVRLGL